MSNHSYRPKGVLVATVTPFHNAGEIDYDVYRLLMTRIIDNGVHGVVPASMTGEFFSLTLEERFSLMLVASSCAQGKLDLIASTLSIDPRETLALCHHAQELGFSALIVSAPAVSSISTEEVIEYYRWIDEKVELPIILYNYPSRLNIDLDIEMTKRLAGLRNVIAYKDTSGAIARLQQAATMLPSLDVVCGLDDLALESYAWGAKSILGGAAAFLAKQHLELQRLCLSDGDFTAGRELMRQMLPLLTLMDRGGKYVQMCRYGCELQGIPVGEPRRPLLSLSAGERAAFQQAFSHASMPYVPSAT